MHEYAVAPIRSFVKRKTASVLAHSPCWQPAGLSMGSCFGKMKKRLFMRMFCGGDSLSCIVSVSPLPIAQ